VLATPQATRSGDAIFASTRWSIIRDAADSQRSSQDAMSALSELCRIYWRPVYLFIRRQGVAQHEAQDLTQGFFADLIASRAYANARQEKGRFRSFLLGTLKHYLADARDHARAQKRGGGAALAELNESTIALAEAQALRDDSSPPDRVYAREWAAALLRHALQRLGDECALAGRDALFAALKSHLGSGNAVLSSYDELARQLGRPATTLRTDVARLRSRYRAILREEVRSIVLHEAEVDDELRHLCRVMTA
jgi:RNA polymerase sigma factor (sigma-70 family)